MSGNYFCHVCGGLVDLIKLQPSDVRLCECEKRFARLRAENEKLTKERDDLRSRRCEVCGYLEHEREHTGCLREQLAALAEQNEKLTKELDEYKSGFEAAASKYRNLKLQMQEIINVC